MKFPVVTLDVVLLAAAVAGFGAGAASALVYDRNRIISGELWRLITGNWVHFSKTHFAYDVLAFGIAGSWIELRGHRGFGLFCLLSAALVGLTVFLARPDLEIFGGLSGLATGATVLLCLHGLRDHTAWRWICLLTLLALVGKTALECTTGQPLFAQSDMLALKAVPECHIAGALTAVLVWYFTAKWTATHRLYFSH